MSTQSTVIAMAAVGTVSASAGWVFRDARARGLPVSKALTWAFLQGVEWPIPLWLYMRIRPRGIREHEAK